MVLVGVLAAMGENQVRRDRFRQTGEHLFDLPALVGEKAVKRVEYVWVSALRNLPGTARRFFGPLGASR